MRVRLLVGLAAAALACAEPPGNAPVVIESLASAVTGPCPMGDVCTDVTGNGNYECTSSGVPGGLATCGGGGGVSSPACASGTTCFYTPSDNTDRCLEDCSPSSGDAGTIADGGTDLDGGTSADGGFGSGGGTGSGSCPAGDLCEDVTGSGNYECMTGPIPAGSTDCSSQQCPSGYHCANTGASAVCLEDCAVDPTGGGSCPASQTCVNASGNGHYACVVVSGGQVQVPPTAGSCDTSLPNSCPTGYSCWTTQQGAAYGSCLADCCPLNQTCVNQGTSGSACLASTGGVPSSAAICSPSAGIGACQLGYSCWVTSQGAATGVCLADCLGSGGSSGNCDPNVCQQAAVHQATCCGQQAKPNQGQTSCASGAFTTTDCENIIGATCADIQAAAQSQGVPCNPSGGGGGGGGGTGGSAGGSTGTAQMGQPCSETNGCVAELECVQVAPNETICTSSCTPGQDVTCPAGYTCVDMGSTSFCELPASDGGTTTPDAGSNDDGGTGQGAQMGQPCSDSVPCAAGLECAGDPSGTQTCLETCDPSGAAACPAAYVCEPTDSGGGLCVVGTGGAPGGAPGVVSKHPAASIPPCGCANDGPTGLAGSILVLLALVLRRRRPFQTV